MVRLFFNPNNVLFTEIKYILNNFITASIYFMRELRGELLFLSNVVIMYIVMFKIIFEYLFIYLFI